MEKLPEPDPQTSTTAEASLPQIDPIELECQRITAELEAHTGTLAFGHAMGAVCGNAGSHPIYDSLIGRAEDLRALLAEFTVSE